VKGQFDFSGVKDRRFVFNPKTNTLILGAESPDQYDEGSHGELLQSFLSAGRTPDQLSKAQLWKEYNAFSIRGKLTDAYIRITETPTGKTTDPESSDALHALYEKLLAVGVRETYSIAADGESGPSRPLGARLKHLGGVGSGIKGHTTSHSAAQALSDYQQNSAMGVNMYLRGDKGNEQDWPFLEKTIAGMNAAFKDDALSKNTLKDLTVHRGIDSHSVAMHIASMKPGDIIADKAYLSTSRSARIARNATGDFNESSVIMHIHVPQGTRVVMGRKDEKERIFNRETKLELIRQIKVGNTIEAFMKVVS
jgi:hypothetical protein